MSVTTGKNIAIVDDDALFMDQLSATLSHRAGMRAVAFTTGDDLLHGMKKQEFSCILIDHELRGETGLALGQTIKQRDPNAPPIIMLTGAGSERTATKAFRIGFSDYVPKRNLDDKELITAIATAITQRQEQNALRAETERLRKDQRLDSLTRLPSTSYVHARLAELSVQQEGAGYDLLAVAPQNMKQLRIQLGHAASERLFRDFADRLSQINAPSAFLGHISTQGLAFVIEKTATDDELADLSKRILPAAVGKVEHQGALMNISAALGHANFPQDGSTPDEVINFALSDLENYLPDDDLAHDAEDHKPIPEPDRRSRDGNDATTADDSPRGSDRRVDTRFRILKKGKIVVPGLNSVIDCTVRNKSDSGAQIRVDGYFAPPGRFQLQIVGSTSPQWVEKRWQVGNDIGVAFQGDEK